MFDPGLVKGLIAVVTMVTFLGICWWAYRPGSRARFEADGWLAFSDDEIRMAANRRSEPDALGESTEKDA